MRGIYAGEVHNVAAGYARNYLIPQKMAVYATSRNFERCGLIDPDIAAKDGGEDSASSSTKFDDEEEEENADIKAADRLRKYLRNKSVKFIRNVDHNVPTMCHPGHVSAKHIRDKLSKQLKIDLEDHETIHIRNDPVVGIEEMDEKEVMQLINNMDDGMRGAAGRELLDDRKANIKDTESVEEEKSANATAPGVGDGGVEDAAADDSCSTVQNKDCDTKVKQLGEYLAKITLAGGQIVPLHFKIERR